MIDLSTLFLSPDLRQEIKHLQQELDVFREAPLDNVATDKLKEHFRTHHIYHSSGIEGNRLTLQETSLVLKEGIDISGKPLGDSIEVKNLGIAFDFLHELVDKEVPITENYLKQLHQLLIGDVPSLNPGQYRTIGVIISGSEHRPPEPFEVPIRMRQLFDWIAQNQQQQPIIVAAIAHHELVKIHPFKDGNGRTARLLLNLILMKSGFPICNIRREQRPDYYNALSLADVGLYEPIIEVVAKNCVALFSEYIRVRDESNRMKVWAQRTLGKDVNLQQVLIKQKAAYELWLNRVNEIKSNFRLVVASIDENLTDHYLSLYEYPSITFEKYQQLIEQEKVFNTNFFSVRFHQSNSNEIVATLLFKFYHDNNPHPVIPSIVPIELHIFEADLDYFQPISASSYAKMVSLRAFYIDKQGQIAIKYASKEDAPRHEKLSIVIQTLIQQIANQLTA